MKCLSENSDVKANSPWVFLFFIHSLFHTDFCRFDVRYNNISVFISSSESDSELRAMSLAIAHFARLQETTSQCALTLCHAVFPVLRLSALLCPVLRPVGVSMCPRPYSAAVHLKQVKQLLFYINRTNIVNLYSENFFVLCPICKKIFPKIRQTKLVANTDVWSVRVCVWQR